jgi:glycosyltransferase involved in cell wall biosynthesis
VVPVFNTESYLEESLESIRRQTYDRWEAIIVNNCSTDRSGEIADRFTQTDERFRVVHCSEFLGQLDNYNRALKQIDESAKYCKIVEADNWIFPECIARMVALAQSDDQVSIVGSYYLHGTTVKGSGLSYSTSVMEGREVCRLQLLDKRYFWGSPSSLLYRADVVRAKPRFFNPEALHADVDNCYEVLVNSRFGFVHQILSFLREGNDGITKLTESYKTNWLSQLMDLYRYGPLFLSERELQDAIRRDEHRYQNFLGLSWIRRRHEKDFWAHHEKGWRLAGMRYNTRALPWWALRAFVEDVLLEPKEMLGRLRGAVTPATSRTDPFDGSKTCEGPVSQSPGVTPGGGGEIGRATRLHKKGRSPIVATSHDQLKSEAGRGGR